MDAFIYANYSFGSILEVKYAYFFTEHWGLSLGVGVSKFSAKGTMNFAGVIKDYPDEFFDKPVDRQVNYDLIFKGEGFVEKQSIWAIEVPLQAQFEHKFGGRHGIYAGLGVKGFFPIAANSKFPKADGTLITTGYEEDFGVSVYHDLPGRFVTTTSTAKPSKAKMRCSIDLQADLGGVFGMSKQADFYLGVYTSLGFLDILPKNKMEFQTNLLLLMNR